VIVCAARHMGKEPTFGRESNMLAGLRFFHFVHVQPEVRLVLSHSYDGGDGAKPREEGLACIFDELTS
jgi:hypothetical protein